MEENMITATQAKRNADDFEKNKNMYYLNSFFEQVEILSKEGKRSVEITNEQYDVIETEIEDILGFKHLETDRHNETHIIGW